MNFQFSKINFKIVSAALAATSAGLAIAVPFSSNLAYNKGLNEGVEQGIEKGREGYVKGYDGGTVAYEGYDGLGWDYDCEKGDTFFRKDVKNIKKGVAYSRSELKERYGTWHDEWVLGAQSTCRALGYKP